MSSQLETTNILKLFLDLYNQVTDYPVAVFYGENFLSIQNQDEYPEFCKYMLAHPKLRNYCKLDQSNRAKNPSSSSCGHCHIGIAFFKHPIFVDNKHYGTMLTGKRRIIEQKYLEEDIFNRRLTQISDKSHLTNEEKQKIKDLFNSVDMVSKEDFNKTCQNAFATLQSFFNEIISIQERSLIISMNTAMTTELSAHELIGPIIEIKGYARLLQKKLMENEDLIENNDFEIFDICQSIINSSERFRIYAENLREGVLNLDKDFIFKNENLLNVIFYCIKPYQEMAKSYGIRILRPKLYPFESYQVEISKREFEIALMNIIHNAVKYSYRGSRNKFRFVSIVGSMSERKGFYEVCVNNYGVGIEPEEIENRTICEKFKRGKLSRDRERIGTGLGLYVVEKIIKKHGGELVFSSEPVDEVDGPHLNKFKLVFPIYQNKGLYDKNIMDRR